MKKIVMLFVVLLAVFSAASAFAQGLENKKNTEGPDFTVDPDAEKIPDALQNYFSNQNSGTAVDGPDQEDTGKAGADPVPVISWEDYVDRLDGGMYYRLSDIGIVMWVPNFLLRQELDEEDIEDGIYRYFCNEDGSWNILILCDDSEGYTIPEMQQELIDDGAYEDVKMYNVNGIPMLSLYEPEMDARFLCYISDPEMFVMIVFYPVSDEDFEPYIEIMTGTIQHPR